jgi:hypothetical protein
MTHVRNHLSLCAPAYGGTVRQLAPMLQEQLCQQGLSDRYDIEEVFTRMADSRSMLETNDDVAAWLDQVIADKSVRVVVFNVALADFNGIIGDVPSGKHAERLKMSSTPRRWPC